MLARVAAPVLALLALLAAAHPARADRSADPDLDRDRTTGSNSADDQVVVVNAAPRLGDLGHIERLRRVLSARHLLFKLPEGLEAALDGRNALIADADAIKDAYLAGDFEAALTIVDQDEQNILGEALNRDPIPALAELSQWRGIIAAALNQQTEAVRWFRAAYRFNPAWTVDTKLASPRVRTMIAKARREPDQEGVLRVESDPEDARMSIDGGDPRPTGKVELAVGLHLVMITAPKRRPYAELVDIRTKDPYRIEISLDKESSADRAARLVDEAAAAPAGQQRLKRAGALAKLTGATRMLVVEEGGDDHVTVRLYDTALHKVSRPLEIEGTATSATIARKIAAALDPDNLVDAGSIVIQTRTRSPKWYERWYVWAGVAAVAGGGILGYEYLTRDPTNLRGF